MVCKVGVMMALPLLRLPSSHPLLPFLCSFKSSPPKFPPFHSSVSSSTHSLYFRSKEFLILAGSSSSETLVFEQEGGESEEKRSEPRRRLIAQNVPWNCSAEDIRALFERHGTVLDVDLWMYDNSRNRGLAFITMASEEEALVALSNLNSYDLNGRIIKVTWARSLQKEPIREPAANSTKKHNVFVGNLSYRARSRDLRELFSSTGKLLSADVIFQSNPRKSTGYGFLSFATKEDAEAAIAAHNGKVLMGRKLRLVLGKPESEDSKRKSSIDELPLKKSEE
ncbi:28 kDa ribonucleoprotein, chloroplastic [Apostasia shenzhenica]|uniref:28 kDa ribonucleoprotein, chloroplastic n=1 Tax=Apostasia shenzhenica TaxID=1088818 RepID=A0A2I0A397_9ASPA|nr:28 kDa ribonucleoprotein, chloroplastic [Apostasia shenzhenica]